MHGIICYFLIGLDGCKFGNDILNANPIQSQRHGIINGMGKSRRDFSFLGWKNRVGYLRTTELPPSWSRAADLLPSQSGADEFLPSHTGITELLPSHPGAAELPLAQTLESPNFLIPSELEPPISLRPSADSKECEVTPLSASCSVQKRVLLFTCTVNAWAGQGL